MSAAYIELAVTSNFSFLSGASHPHELVEEAAKLGYTQIGIADKNSLAGVVRAHRAAKEVMDAGTDIRIIVGARLVLTCGFEVIVYPHNRDAYGALSRLLTLGNRRAEKGDCILGFEDLTGLDAAHTSFIVMPPYGLGQDFEKGLATIKGLAPTTTYLGATRLYKGDDDVRLQSLVVMAHKHATPMVAVGDVLYHVPNRRPLQDVLTCIRTHTTITEAGFKLEVNAERHLKHAADIAHIFKGYEEAVARTQEIARACTFSLDELAYTYPKETFGSSATPQDELERLTWIGAKKRYPEGVSDTIKATIEHELALIKSLDYAPYFLTVDDIVRFARDRGILCQGRGSAANSAVCFCLGITSVDPTKIDLLFERFVSADRGEPPDIDVDFEHERREDVIQYIYAKYGRHRAGIASTVITYRTKSAVREVGKAMGLSEDAVGALSGSAAAWSSFGTPHGLKAKSVDEIGVDASDPTIAQVLKLSRQILGFPRHLSQHVGGFVITDGPLEDVIPIANAAMDDRTFVEWDKDDLAALNILKIDVLALGMLTAIRKGFTLIENHYGKSYDLATVPAEDVGVYDMICRADTVGVFQIESRAQMSMLPRLKPRCFYDLVIEIAIVRPGPIQGDMVHPYLKRRQGKEAVSYPSEALAGVLSKTLGVPLFQEQAMKIAIVGAGFTPGEADRLRKAMATFRHSGTIGGFKQRFFDGMLNNGYTPEFAENCFKQIEGFSDYGFPESHSASFALLAYVSSWMKCYYPDVFTCALLNSLPMGFYSSASLVRDLREHGGEVRAVDVNHSHWDHTLEPTESSLAITPDGGGAMALRLGFRQVKGLRESDMQLIMRLRGSGYDSVRDLYFRTGLSARVIERMARADCFRSIGLNRRDALWAVQALSANRGDKSGARSAVEDLPLFASAMSGTAEQLQREVEIALPTMPLGEHVVEDYTTLSLSLKAHPASFMRDSLRARGFASAADLVQVPDGSLISLAGLVLVRQRPGTATGVIFATLEDETGVMNIIIWPKLFEENRQTVIGARFLGLVGQVQKEEGVIHVIARHLHDLSHELARIIDCDNLFDPTGPADEAGNDRGDARRNKRVMGVMPKGRNFH